MALSLKQVKKSSSKANLKSSELSNSLEQENYGTKPWEHILPTNEAKPKEKRLDEKINFFEERSILQTETKRYGGAGLWCEVLNI
jgi:hypothetical protein